GGAMDLMLVISAAAAGVDDEPPWTLTGSPATRAASVVDLPVPVRTHRYATPQVSLAAANVRSASTGSTDTFEASMLADVGNAVDEEHEKNNNAQANFKVDPQQLVETNRHARGSLEFRALFSRNRRRSACWLASG